MAALAALLAVASVIVACTTSSVVVPSANVSMSQVTRSTTIAAGASGTVSATCPANTQLTSGGYAVQGTPERVVATASYPTAADTWTASAMARTDGSITLNAYANCLHASFSMSEQIVSEDWNAPAKSETIHAVACPSGTTVTGAGYALRMSGADVISSFAGTQAASGDQITPYGTVAAYDQDATTGSGTTYALCAASTAVSVAQEQTTRSVTSGDDTEMTVGCSNGVLVGGGFGTSQVDLATPVYAFRSTASPGFLYWQVDLAYHNDARPLTVAAMAVCAFFSGAGTPAPDTPTAAAGDLPVLDGYPNSTPIPIPSPTAIPTATPTPTPTPPPGAYLSLKLSPSQYCTDNPSTCPHNGDSDRNSDAHCSGTSGQYDYPTFTLTNIGGQMATWTARPSALGVLAVPASGSIQPSQSTPFHLIGTTGSSFSVSISWPSGDVMQEISQGITCVG
jgi:hypothetical protein